MEFNTRIKNYLDGMTVVHQLLVVTGLIIGVLISAWSYTKDTIIAAAGDSLKQALSESVSELGLVTDSTLSTALSEFEANQNTVLISLLDLHYKELLRIDSTIVDLKKIKYSIYKNNSDIKELTSVVIEIGKKLSNDNRRLVTIIESNATTDSLKNEIEKAKLQNEIDKILNTLKSQHEEAIYNIKVLAKAEHTRGFTKSKFGKSFDE